MHVFAIDVENKLDLIVKVNPVSTSLMNLFKNINSESIHQFNYLFFWNENDIDASGILFEDFYMIDGIVIDELFFELADIPSDSSDFNDICFNSKMFLLMNEKLNILDDEDAFTKFTQLIEVFIR